MAATVGGIVLQELIPPAPPQYAYYLPLMAKPSRPMANVPRLGYMIEGNPAGQTVWMIPGSIARYRVRWDKVEREPGVFDWAELDEAVILLRAHNAGLMLNVIGTPGAYRMDAGIACSPPREEHIGRLADFCELLSRRYQAEVIEVWNEPEVSAAQAQAAGLAELLGGFGMERAAHYGRCVAAVGERMRSLSLATWVAAGSLMLETADFWLRARPFADGMYDAVSFHSYSHYPSTYYDNPGDKAGMLMETGESAPLILSEFALLAQEDSEEFRAAQARYLAHVVERMPLWSIECAVWYPLAQNDWLHSDLVEGEPTAAWFVMRDQAQ